jgi:DNA-binding LacI/PurR family transcriptional regulator
MKHPLIQKQYERVANELRRRLLDGLEANRQVKLPTQREISHELGASIITVRTAVKMLEDEGLITTKHRSGSLLSEKLLAGKRTIAVIVGYWSDAQHLSSWHPLVLGALCRFLEENGWRFRIYTLFHGTMERDERVMDQLMTDAGARKFAGVISFPDQSSLRADFVELLQQRDIYCLAFDARDNRNNILLDFSAFGMMGANHLLSQGVKRIGMVGACFTLGNHQPIDDLNGARQAVASHPEAEMRPEWCVSAVSSFGNGTAAFKQIWAQKTHPEGLIVSDEFSYYGVVCGMLELGVRYPQDLELVAQLTEGAPEDTLYKPPRLVFSPRMVAWQAFNAISGMIRDRMREIPSVRLSPTLALPTAAKERKGGAG